MEKYLVLKFSNAGLFRKHRNTKDKIVDLDIIRDRKNEPEFVEPITVHQISNMLHVLFGERPKPTIRKSVYKQIDYYFDKAKNSYLKINSYKNKKGLYPNEFIQLNKSQWNSWQSSSAITWERVRRLLDDGLFELFMDKINDAFNLDCSKLQFKQVIELIKNSKDKKIEELVAWLKENKRGALISGIYDGDKDTGMNANIRVSLTNTNGVDTIIRLNGEILVPVSEDDIAKLRNTKGCARLLDGGLILIDGIKHENVINVNDFTKVSEISLKTQ